MRRNALISTSGFKKELRFGFSMPKNLCKSDFSPKNAILSLFLPFFHCACVETPWFLHPVSKRSSDSDSACPKTYIARILARKRDFKPIFVRFHVATMRMGFLHGKSGFSPKIWRKYIFYFSDPQMAPPCARPDLLVYSAKDSVNRSGLYPDRRPPPKEKKMKKNVVYVQYVGYSPDGNPQNWLQWRCPLCNRCGVLLSLPVNRCRCGRTWKSGFLGIFCGGPYNIAQATAWACDNLQVSIAVWDLQLLNVHFDFNLII